MRNRYFIVVATIAASVLTACSDAAVDPVTAPPSAATPVQPVTAQWPSVDEYEEEEISSAIGIQIKIKPYFDSGSFVVDAYVHFTWANDVGATVWASVQNKDGTVINASEASIRYQRLAVPVPSGDTTFTVRVSTNRINCGLTGKSAYAGHAAAKAIDSRIVVISLWEQQLGKTNGPDVLQPACPPEGDECQSASRVTGGTSAALPNTSVCDDEEAPAPPNGGTEPVEVCYLIWREFWIMDLNTGQRILLFSIPIGYFCFTPQE